MKRGTVPAAGPKLKVKKSKVGGRGLFALEPIARGTRVIEYRGERKRWEDFEENEENYVFLFSVGRDTVIDPFSGGNEARFINHSCDANCEAVQEGGRIFIDSIRDIAKGEELFYDYGLVLGRKPTAEDRERYACRCGAATCRGTMLRLPAAKKKAGVRKGRD